MALSTRYSWTTGCDPASTGAYDVETVLLHENGHVAGLDHSDDERAVMYPSYGGPRCALAEDDAAAVRTLYPGDEPEPASGPQAAPAETPAPSPPEG